MKNKLRAASALAVVAAVAALGLWNREAPSSLELGAPAPPLSAPDLAGGITRLSSFEGRVLLLNFWATWCTTCAEEMPALERLYRKHKERGFAVFAPAVDGARGPVMEFLSRTGVSFPVALADPRASAAYAVRGLPTSYLIGRDGRIFRRYVGPLDIDALENDILALLEKPK